MSRIPLVIIIILILTYCSPIKRGEIVLDNVDGRNLQIYLPPGYDSTLTYPVAYFHDGQNLFDTTTSYSDEWKIDEVMDSLISRKRIEPMVIVGIYNGGEKRAAEYVPYEDRNILQYMGSWDGAKHVLYEDFIVRKILPYVENKYNVSNQKEDRAIFGSSYGGLNALWLGMYNSDKFSFIGSISPSLWVGEGAMLIDFRSLDTIPDINIWIDQGSTEWDGRAIGLISLLEQKGRSYGENLWYYEDNNGIHHESSWSKRIAIPLLLFKGQTFRNKEDLDSELVFAYRSWIENPPVLVRINALLKRSDGITYSLLNKAKYQCDNCTIDEYGSFGTGEEDEMSFAVSYNDLTTNLSVGKSDVQDRLNAIRSPD